MGTIRTIAPQEVELYRRHLHKVLDSSEFAGSRQLREFLIYVAEAAFAGRQHLDQSEIAEQVLHRTDFDPLDDASVRKLATLTRQKMERYAKGEGVNDPVDVLLPLRSYIPSFRLRGDGAAVAFLPPVAAPPETPLRPRFPVRRLIAGVVLLLALAAAIAVYLRRSTAGQDKSFIIQARRGDMMHEQLDVAGDDLRLGPKLGEVEDLVVRMKFAPEEASQQAGLLVFENPDRYVKLGRQFDSRPEWEFGLETRARYQKPPGTFAYDPSAQNGTRVWLCIRRRHNEFEGFASHDSVHWDQIGSHLTMPDPLPDAKIGIYSYTGRTNAAATTAEFDHLRTGLMFQNWLQTDPATVPEGWTMNTSCGEGLGVPRFLPNALEFAFTGRTNVRCDWTLMKPIPPGNWTLETKVDFRSVNGTIAGLMVRGKSGYLRLIRWDINGGSVTAEHFGRDQVSARDFPGSPPLIMRIDCEGGILTSTFSRDDEHFIPLPSRVNLKDLGGDAQFGIHAGVSSWVGVEPLPPVRFAYVQRLVKHVGNFR